MKYMEYMYVVEVYYKRNSLIFSNKFKYGFSVDNICNNVHLSGALDPPR